MVEADSRPLRLQVAWDGQWDRGDAEMAKTLGDKTMLESRLHLKLRHAAAIALVGLLVTLSYAQQKAEAPVMPPETARTVHAFAGHWSFTGIDLEPGAKDAAKITMTVDCVTAALGAAVACTFAGQSTDAGRIEASAVIGYSPDERVVRWMEISSTGEYHEHKGTWKGDTIEFEPLPYTFLGDKFVERLTVSFPSPDTLVLMAITETKNGPSKLEGKAKRR